MSDSFFSFYAKYFILLCAVLGFYFTPKLKLYGTQNLPYFLIFLFLGECVATLLFKYKVYYLITPLYNYVLLPAQIIFYLWLIGYKFLSKKSFAKRLVFLYLTSLVIEVFVGLVMPLNIFSKSYSLGGIMLSYLVILYILQLTKSDEVITFYKNLHFWVCIGVALYYTLSFPFYTYYNTLLNKYENIFYVYRNIIGHLSVGMYLTFIFGMIWSKKT